MSEQRTLTQNAAMHLYCDHLAEAFNDAGFTVRTVLKEDWDVSWTAILVKELIWKAFQKAKYGTLSTTEMTTKQVSEIFDDININLGEKFGMHVAFPDRFNRDY